MLKKILLGLAAIAVSSAALAHPGRGDERHRYSHHHQHHRAHEHRAERFHQGWHRPVRMERERHAFVQQAPRMAWVR
jgi:hypothetical protein